MERGKDLKKVGEFITPRYDVALSVAEILISNGFHVTKYNSIDFRGTHSPIEVYIDNK